VTAVHLYDCDPQADAGTPADGHRPLAEIAADAIQAECGECWPGHGNPCDAPGLHLARYARARRRGLISGPDMAVVLDAAPDVFEPSTVIPQPRKAAA
jgi:hypothetical protein